MQFLESKVLLLNPKMEDLCERIPLLSKYVFANLNDQSLTNCRKASRRLNESLDSERLAEWSPHHIAAKTEDLQL